MVTRHVAGRPSLRRHVPDCREARGSSEASRQARTRRNVPSAPLRSRVEPRPSLVRRWLRTNPPRLSIPSHGTLDASHERAAFGWKKRVAPCRTFTEPARRSRRPRRRRLRRPATWRVTINQKTAVFASSGWATDRRPVRAGRGSRAHHPLCGSTARGRVAHELAGTRDQHRAVRTLIPLCRADGVGSAYTAYKTAHAAMRSPKGVKMRA